MSGSQTFQRLSEQSLEEHQQIHFYLDQLLRAMKGLEPNAGGEESLRRLAVQIESFRERLDEHFHAEEHGGLFQAVLDAYPGAHVEVRRLTVQHGSAIEVLEMARIRARRCDPGEIASLQDEIDRFVKMMRQHEREEEALLRRALQEDEA